MVTSQIAKNINQTNFRQFSGNAVYEAKRSLLNWLGVAIGAANHESMDKVLSVSRLMESSQQATIFGRNEKTDMLFAALLNGMSSHIYDFDDTLLETVLHPSSPVFPAVLAYTEFKKKTGREVLEAFIIGCEVQARLALAVYPSHYWRGWHITGSVGGIGAAAAMSKLLGLNEEKTSFAIGIASTDPTGLREMFGTMTKPYHPGKAAMNGMLAAFIAGEGFTSSKQALEAERGFINVLSEETKMGLLTENWGDKWEIEKNSYKPFASGIVTHPAIDGIISIQRAHSLKADEVEEIIITGHPLVKELTGKTDLKTGLEGKFSVYHCVAAGFLRLKAGVNEFTDDFVNKQEVKTLRSKVRLRIDEKIKEDQVRITVKLTDGKELSHFVEHAIGSMDLPMSDQQLKDKFKDVTGNIISEEAKERLIDQIYRLEEIEDLDEFFQLCTPVESGSPI
jgi:2-methylcitrate dehydratase PrpD